MNTKTTICVLSMLALLSCSGKSLDTDDGAGQETTETPGKVWHPMLFFNYYEGELIKEAIAGTHASQWAEVVAAADSKVSRNPPADRTDTGEQLWQRDVGNTIALLSFTGYMSDEHQKYFDAAYKWAEAAGSYATWGTDDTPDGQEFGLVYGHYLLGIAMLYDYGQNYLTEAQLQTVRQILMTRVERQYNAYRKEELNYIQNHTWINICGMLSAAMVLRNDTGKANTWIDFAQSVLDKTSRLLIKDGASQEGPGYWQYGMEFLMMDYDLSASLGHDYYQNSTWWENTARYAMFLTLPSDWCSETSSIVDWGDSPRYSWYGPEHLYRRLASLNDDRYAQYFAGKANAYDVSASWLNVLWYDPEVKAAPSLYSYPRSWLFEEMGLFASRTDWDGNETLLVFRSGAPLGKSATSSSGYHSGDMGHIHPDAGHFIIFSNGEYILKNNGYVKRQTKYHNTLVVNDKGQYGEKSGYFTPWPLDPSKYPDITLVSSDDTKDEAVADISDAYMAEAGLTEFTRRMIWLKKENALLLIDDISCISERNLKLLFYPECQSGTVSGNIYTAVTPRNNIRIENLSSDAGIALTTQFVEERSGGDGTEQALLTVSADARQMRFITAVTWGPLPAEAKVAVYDESSGEIKVGNETVKL